MSETSFTPDDPNHYMATSTDMDQEPDMTTMEVKSVVDWGEAEWVAEYERLSLERSALMKGHEAGGTDPEQDRDLMFLDGKLWVAQDRVTAYKLNKILNNSGEITVESVTGQDS